MPPEKLSEKLAALAGEHADNAALAEELRELVEDAEALEALVEVGS